MTRVWFDAQGAAMVIERFGVFPAGSLRMTAADGWLRLAPPGLKDAFASPWALLADEGGDGFASQAAAAAYLAGELARRAPLFEPSRELLVASNGQTEFTLSAAPSAPAAVRLWINGQRFRPPAFALAGALLTWASGFALNPTDEIEAEYT